MATNTTRWRPNTCDCVIEYTWDSTSDPATRVHTPSAIVQTCSRHATIVTLVSRWAQLTEENPRLNKLITRAQSSFPALFTAEGAFLGSWSFDANHVLNVTLPGVTTNQRTTIQNWCDTNLGAGKVVIS